MIEPIKPESLYTDDERKLLVRISLLEDRIKHDADIIQTLADKNTELETTIKQRDTTIADLRKNTLYNKSVYMQNNYKWMSAIIGTVITVTGSIATVVYKFIL
jgi:uncharacterized coiled-coil protein SlyX